MPNEKKRWRWRAYLDDFRQDATGRYIYTGKHFTFVGDERARKIYFAKLIVFGVLALLATAFPECLPPVGISRSPLTLIPWALQVIAVLVADWSVFRILWHTTETRAYIYNATVKTLPVKSAFAAFFAAATVICQVIYIILNGISSDFFTISRVIGPPVALAAETFLFLTVKTGKWEEK